MENRAKLNLDAQDVQNRRDMTAYLGQSLADQYKVQSAESEVSQTSTYIKTYLAEVHSSRDETLESQLANVFSEVSRLKDETLLRARDSGGIAYFIDIRDPRFLLIHTIGKARDTDMVRDQMTEPKTSNFDHAWLPRSFLLSRITGQMTGFKYRSDDFAQGFTRSAVPPPPEFQETKPNRVPQFRLQVTGQYRARGDFDEIERAEILLGRKALEEIETREVDDRDNHMSSSIYSDGKIVGFGTSMNLHLSLTSRLLRDYSKIIRTIEDHYSLGWRHESRAAFHRGAPFLVRFPDRFRILEIQEFAESLFTTKRPFRLLGLFHRSSSERLDVEAIDLHTGDPVSFEITNEWIRIYLPVGSCGNIVARLYSNLQHAVDSDISVLTGDEEDIFAADGSHEVQ